MTFTVFCVNDEMQHLRKWVKLKGVPWYFLYSHNQNQSVMGAYMEGCVALSTRWCLWFPGGVKIVGCFFLHPTPLLTQQGIGTRYNLGVVNHLLGEASPPTSRVPDSLNSLSLPFPWGISTTMFHCSVPPNISNIFISQWCHSQGFTQSLPIPSPYHQEPPTFPSHELYGQPLILHTWVFLTGISWCAGWASG